MRNEGILTKKPIDLSIQTEDVKKVEMTFKHNLEKVKSKTSIKRHTNELKIFSKDDGTEPMRVHGDNQNPRIHINTAHSNYHYTEIPIPIGVENTYGASGSACIFWFETDPSAPFLIVKHFEGLQIKKRK